MQFRRAGGRVRYIPADVAAWPSTFVGLALLMDFQLISNRVADGPRTVRVLLAAPDLWLRSWTGWLGFALLAIGVALVLYSARRPDPHRWGTAVRYPAFAGAALLLALATAASAFDAQGHVTDVSSDGLQWRFQVQPRTQLANDVTTVLLALTTIACYAFSFGPSRWADFEAYAARQATRDRVPASTADNASTTSTMPAGEPSQKPSRRN